MTPENYTALKKRIQELVPEIMELKLGCEVRINIVPNDYGECIVTETVVDTTLDHENVITWNRRHHGKFPILNIKEILGRPIRLADCILSIHRKYVYPDEPYQPSVSIDIDELVNCHWELENDDLDKQTDRTKMELYNILISKAKV